MNPDQSGVRQAGPIPVKSNDDLSAARSRLVQLGNLSGALVATLPTDDTANALSILHEGGVSLAGVDVEPFCPPKPFRVRLKGTCNPGDQLVLADPAVAADKGKLRALPEAAGTYKLRAIALEAGVDGQLVECLPASPVSITVSG